MRIEEGRKTTSAKDRRAATAIKRARVRKRNGQRKEREWISNDIRRKG